MTETETTTRILIADDHQLVIDGIKSLLSSESRFAVTHTVNNGLHALRQIESNPTDYDLLISDISMPDMTGIELCKKVKENYSHIKVLMLSMYSNPSIIKESIAVEADGYLLKNSGKEEFVSAINRVINNGTYYSQEILPFIIKSMKGEKISQKYGALTPREQEVLQLIVKEFTSEEIADKLCISKKTVDNHRASLLVKTESKSTIGLVKFAMYNGLVGI